jgi:hypothetical protein
MSEQAQVGDTVRLTLTMGEGIVYKLATGLFVSGWSLNAPNRTVEILSRAIPPLPSEPGTWWLDRDGAVWKVNASGTLFCIALDWPNPEKYTPFRQLVLK